MPAKARQRARCGRTTLAESPPARCRPPRGVQDPEKPQGSVAPRSRLHAGPGGPPGAPAHTAPRRRARSPCDPAPRRSSAPARAAARRRQQQQAAAAAMARRYDSRTTIFSPEGRLYQVEYAMEAISNAGAAIGCLAKDGVVLIAEKKITSKVRIAGCWRRRRRPSQTAAAARPLCASPSRRGTRLCPAPHPPPTTPLCRPRPGSCSTPTPSACGARRCTNSTTTSHARWRASRVRGAAGPRPAGQRRACAVCAPQSAAGNVWRPPVPTPPLLGALSHQLHPTPRLNNPLPHSRRQHPDKPVPPQRPALLPVLPGGRAGKGGLGGRRAPLPAVGAPPLRARRAARHAQCRRAGPGAPPPRPAAIARSSTLPRLPSQPRKPPAKARFLTHTLTPRNLDPPSPPGAHAR